MKKVIAKGMIAAAAIAVISSSAMAEGFLAGLARDAGLINEQQRRAADNLNKQLGQPVDRLANTAAGAAVNWVVPGSGPLVTGALEARRQGLLRSNLPLPRPQYAPYPMQQPLPYPQQPEYTPYPMHQTGMVPPPVLPYPMPGPFYR